MSNSGAVCGRLETANSNAATVFTRLRFPLQTFPSLRATENFASISSTQGTLERSMKPFEMGRKNKRDKAGGLLTRQPCILYAVGIGDYICQNICGKSPPALLSLPFDREKGRHPLDDVLLQFREALTSRPWRRGQPQSASG